MTNRWAVLTLFCVARLAMGLHFQAVPALGPFLAVDLGIGYAGLGLLLGLYKLPGIVVSIPGGLLGARFGDKALVLVALSLLTAGAVLLPAAPSFPIAVAARLLTGTGGVLLSMQLTKMTTDWFIGKEMSTALGILMPTWPLGLALAMAALGPLAAATSWQTASYATAAYSATAFALVAALYREPVPIPGTAASRPPLWTISTREFGLVTLAGACWMFLNTGFIVFVSFAPAVLTQRGFGFAQASILVSWASFLSVGSVVAAGYLTDRTKRGSLLIVLGTLASALAVLAFPRWEPALLWIVLFGVALGVPVPAVVAMPGAVLRPETRSIGFGVWNTVYYAGMTTLPPLAGAILEATGNVAAPMWVAGLLWLMILPPFWALRSLQTHERAATA